MREIVRDDRYYLVPEGRTAPADTVIDALEFGRAIIADEAHWIKAEAFSNPYPEEDPTTPFCNSWGVCAVGAVWVATCGIRDINPPTGSTGSGVVMDPGWAAGWPVPDGSYRVYESACEYLHAAAQRRGGFEYITEYNDHEATTHGEVLAAFDEAIEVAKQEASVSH